MSHRHRALSSRGTVGVIASTRLPRQHKHSSSPRHVAEFACSLTEALQDPTAICEVGFAENAPMPTSTVPEGALDFRAGASELGMSVCRDKVRLLYTLTIGCCLNNARQASQNKPNKPDLHNLPCEACGSNSADCVGCTVAHLGSLACEGPWILILPQFHGSVRSSIRL